MSDRHFRFIVEPISYGTEVRLTIGSYCVDHWIWRQYVDLPTSENDAKIIVARLRAMADFIERRELK